MRDFIEQGYDMLVLVRRIVGLVLCTSENNVGTLPNIDLCKQCESIVQTMWHPS